MADERTKVVAIVLKQGGIPAVLIPKTKMRIEPWVLDASDEGPVVVPPEQEDEETIAIKYWGPEYAIEELKRIIKRLEEGTHVKKRPRG